MKEGLNSSIRGGILHFKMWSELRRIVGIDPKPVVAKEQLLSGALERLRTSGHDLELEHILSLRAELSHGYSGSWDKDFQAELDDRLEKQYGQDWWLLVDAWKKSAEKRGVVV